MTCKLLSVLLHYPDEPLLAHLGAIRASAAGPPEDQWQSAIEAFTRYLDGKPLIELQIDYTALFDINTATPLNLVNHLELDPHARADLLSRLQAVYQAAGLQCVNGELPDYLPLLLEYLWLHPEGWEQAPLRETLAAVPPLLDRLQTAHPAYAALLQPMEGALQRCRIAPPQEAPDDHL